MTHICNACGCQGETEASDETSLPNGWFVRRIDDDNYVLCDVCGSIRQFRGGLSAYLMDALELDENARCDVSAEVAVLRNDRQSLRRRQK